MGFSHYLNRTVTRCTKGFRGSSELEGRLGTKSLNPKGLGLGLNPWSLGYHVMSTAYGLGV